MEKKPYNKPAVQRRSPEEIVKRLFEIAGHSDTASSILKDCMSEPDEDGERSNTELHDQGSNPR